MLHQVKYELYFYNSVVINTVYDILVPELHGKRVNLKKQHSMVSKKSSVDESSDDDEESTTEISENAESESEEEIMKKGSLTRILKLNGPEWPYLLVGSIAALVVGASFPIVAVIFGDVFGVSYLFHLKSDITSIV